MISCVHLTRNMHAVQITYSPLSQCDVRAGYVSIKKCEIQASCWFSSNLPICMPHCTRYTAAIGQRTLFNYKFVLFLLYSYVRACGLKRSYFIFQSRKKRAKIGGILLFMVYGSRNSSESNATLQFAQMFRSYVNYSTNFVDLNDKTIHSEHKAHTVDPINYINR